MACFGNALVACGTVSSPSDVMRCNATSFDPARLTMNTFRQHKTHQKLQRFRVFQFTARWKLNWMFRRERNQKQHCWGSGFRQRLDGSGLKPININWRPGVAPQAMCGHAHNCSITVALCMFSRCYLSSSHPDVHVCQVSRDGGTSMAHTTQTYVTYGSVEKFPQRQVK